MRRLLAVTSSPKQPAQEPRGAYSETSQGGVLGEMTDQVRGSSCAGV